MATLVLANFMWDRKWPPWFWLLRSCFLFVYCASYILCFEVPTSPELKRTHGRRTTDKNVKNHAGFARFCAFEVSASAELKATQISEKCSFHAGFARFCAFEVSASAELKATQISEMYWFHVCIASFLGIVFSASSRLNDTLIRTQTMKNYKIM